MGISAMGWGLIIFIAIFVTIGCGMVAFVKGSGKRYIVCGKALPFFFVGTMLMAQAVDANTSLGAASLAYEVGFWEGFTIPLGLATCLLITALFFANLKVTSDDCQTQFHCNLTNVMLNSLHCRCCCMRLAKLKASLSSQR